MADKSTFSPSVSPADYYVGKITNISRLQNFTTLKTTLEGFGLLQRFEDLCFGFITRMKHIEFTAGLMHHILLMQDRDQSGKEMRIIFNGTPHIFGYEEFSLITGMMFSGDEECPPRTGWLRNKYFKTDKAIKKADLEKVFVNLPVSTEVEDVLRLALIYTLEIILLADHNLRAINDEYLELVEDLDRFNIYPWGKIVYEFTVRRLKTLMLHKVGGVATTYSVYGFSWALQVWAYEAIQVGVADLALKISPDALPRILRWENPKKGQYLKFWDLNQNIFQRSDFQMLKRLTPKEKESRYYISAQQYAFKVRRSVPNAPNLGGMDDDLPSKGDEHHHPSGHSDDDTDHIPNVQHSSHSSTSIMEVLHELRDLKNEMITIKENQLWIKDALKKLLRQQKTSDIGDQSRKPSGNSSRVKHVPRFDTRKVQDEHHSMDEEVVRPMDEEPVVATYTGKEIILFTGNVGEETTILTSDKDEKSVGVTEECSTEVNLGKKPIDSSQVEENLTDVDVSTMEAILEAAPIMSGPSSMRLGSLGSKGPISSETSAPFGTTYSRRKRKVGPSLKSPYLQPKKKSGISIGSKHSDDTHLLSLYDAMRSYDEARYTFFLEWLYNNFSNNKENINVGCPSKGMANSSWFHRILKLHSSLLNEHIDCGLWLLRKK